MEKARERPHGEDPWVGEGGHVQEASRAHMEENMEIKRKIISASFQQGPAISVSPPSPL